jgi:hypothetical protein
VILWEACLQVWAIDLPYKACVVELGCLESPWAAHLREARPDVTVVGIDARASSVDGPPFSGIFVKGDASARRTWQEATERIGRHTFDAVVGLSSVEHFGLGYYGDPMSREADRQALALAAEHCAPTGWLYYDVPWATEAPMVTAHWRRYTDLTLPHTHAQAYGMRWIEKARTWVTPQQEQVLHPGPPASLLGNPHPFYYIAVWAARG